MKNQKNYTELFAFKDTAFSFHSIRKRIPLINKTIQKTKFKMLRDFGKERNYNK